MTTIHRRPADAHDAVEQQETVVTTSVARKALAVLRIGFGLTFLWAFLDKLLALGFSTGAITNEQGAKTGTDYFGPAAWINGGNPTEGFLSGSIGPFSGIYHDIAGNTVVNVLFMAGLLVIAVGLLLGIYMRFACAAAALMLILMWSASLPPANDPFMDDHIVYALVLAGLALVGAGNTLGLGRWWARTSLVRGNAWLG